MSLPEVLLWRELRGRKPKYRRQFPIAEYIADFACTTARLVIEIDGAAHDMGDRPQRDEKRSRVLQAKGWKVVRIAAARVLADPQAVTERILMLANADR